MATLYEVQLIGQYSGQVTINRLNFTSDIDDPTTTSALALAQALGFNPAAVTEPENDTVLRAYLDSQITSFRLDEIIVRSIYSVIDFFTTPVVGTGWLGTMSGTGGASVPFISAKLETNRVRTDIRRGTLALTPPLDGDIDIAGVISSGPIAEYTVLAAALNAPPSWTTLGITTQYRPTVVKKEKYAVPGSDPVRYAYRYYETEAEQFENIALGVTWSPVGRVTSQTSRRFGRGI